MKLYQFLFLNAISIFYNNCKKGTNIQYIYIYLNKICNNTRDVKANIFPEVSYQNFLNRKYVQRTHTYRKVIFKVNEKNMAIQTNGKKF